MALTSKQENVVGPESVISAAIEQFQRECEETGCRYQPPSEGSIRPLVILRNEDGVLAAYWGDLFWRCGCGNDLTRKGELIRIPDEILEDLDA